MEGAVTAFKMLNDSFLLNYRKMSDSEKRKLIQDMVMCIPVSDDLVIEGVREGLRVWRFPPLINEIVEKVGAYSDKMYLWYRSFKDMGLEWKGVGKDYFPTVRGLDDLYGRVG